MLRREFVQSLALPLVVPTINLEESENPEGLRVVKFDEKGQPTFEGFEKELEEITKNVLAEDVFAKDAKNILGTRANISTKHGFGWVRQNDKVTIFGDYFYGKVAVTVHAHWTYGVYMQQPQFKFVMIRSILLGRTKESIKVKTNSSIKYLECKEDILERMKNIEGNYLG